MIFPRRHIKIPAKVVGQMARAFAELGDGEGQEGDRIYMVGVELDRLHWGQHLHARFAWGARRRRFVRAVKWVMNPLLHPRALFQQRRALKDARVLVEGRRVKREAHQYNGLFPIGEAPLFTPDTEEP